VLGTQVWVCSDVYEGKGCIDADVPGLGLRGLEMGQELLFNHVDDAICEELYDVRAITGRTQLGGCLESECH